MIPSRAYHLVRAHGGRQVAKGAGAAPPPRPFSQSCTFSDMRCTEKVTKGDTWLMGLSFDCGSWHATVSFPLRPEFVSHLFTEDGQKDASLVPLTLPRRLIRDKGAGQDKEGLYPECPDRDKKPTKVMADTCLGLTE